MQHVNKANSAAKHITVKTARVVPAVTSHEDEVAAPGGVYKQ
jgi:hypothetical protein